MRSSLRALAGGCLAAAGAAMVLKRTVTGGEGSSESCINDQFCRDCSAVSNCRLPQAMSFRDHNRGDKRD